MKFTLLIASLFLSLGFLMSFAKGSKVFYCDSPNGKRYHYKKECSGLQKCTHTIRETTISGASKLGLTECKLED